MTFPPRAHRWPRPLALLLAASLLPLAAACRESSQGAQPTPSVTETPVPATAAPTDTPAPAPAVDSSDAARLRDEGEFEAAAEAYAELVEDSDGEARQAALLEQARLLSRLERHDEARGVLDEYLAAAGPAGDATAARYLHALTSQQLEDTAAALDGFDRYAAAGGPLAGYASAERAKIIAATGDIAGAGAAAQAVMASGVRADYKARFAREFAAELEGIGADTEALAWYGIAESEGEVSTSRARAGGIRKRAGDPAWVGDYLFVIQNYPASGASLSLIDELDAAGVPLSDYSRGLAQYRNFRNPDARASFERALANGDRPAESSYYLGALDERADDVESAIARYAQVVALGAASALADDALWWRGRLFEVTGRYAEASALYAQLLANYPSSEWAADARFHAGLALYRSGDIEAAAFAWGAAANTGDEAARAQALYWQGRAELEGASPNGGATLSLLIDESPGDFYALRARALLGLGDEPLLTGASDRIDWNVVADWYVTRLGYDPRSAVPDADPRWAMARDLEVAGMHDESVAVHMSIVRDESGNAASLYRATRRLQEEGYVSTAARSATTLISLLGREPAPPDDLYRVAYPLAYDDLVEAASDTEDIEPLLLLALVRQESYYDPEAGSSAGALGLTQVIEPTGRAIADALGEDNWVLTDLFRPKLSLRFGASYIADQLTAFDGNAYHAFAAYNGGPGTASNAIDSAGGDLDLFVEDIEWDETRLYVKLVTEHWARYRQLYEGLAAPSLPQ